MSVNDSRRGKRTNTRKAARSFERFARRFRLTQLDRVRFLTGDSVVRPGILLAGTALATSLYVFQVAPAMAQQTWLGAGGPPADYNTAANWNPNDVPDSAGETAVFQALGAPQVNVSLPVTVSGFLFDGVAQAYTITGAQVTISGIGIVNNSGAAQSIANVLAGAAGISQNAGGSLTLSGANTYTGGTSITAGTLNVTGAGTLGAVANTTALSGTGILDLNTTTQTQATVTQAGTSTIQSTGGAGGLNVGTYQLTGGTVAAGVTITATTAFNLQAGTVSGILAGAGALTKSTAGTVTLTGANTYTGATAITGGTLNIQNSAALGATGVGSETTVAAGATLQLQGGIAVGAEALSLAGTGTSTNGALQNVSGANSYAGAITLTADSRINSDADTLTLTGGISGAGSSVVTLGGAGNGAVTTVGIGGSVGSLVKDGAGTWTLSAANAYGGGAASDTTVNAGTLAITGAGTLGIAANGVAVSGGTLDLGTTNQTQNGGLILTGGTIQNGTLTSSGTFDVQAGAVSAVLAGTGAVSKTTAGTVTFSGTNTYSGTTTINAGVLAANSSAALGNGTATNTLVFGGGTLRADGTITSPAARGVTLNATGLIDTNGNAVSIAGIISDGGGGFGLTKSGGGTLTLSGANTYSGATQLNVGTLALGSSGALGTSALTAAAGTVVDYAGGVDITNAVTINGLVQFNQTGGAATQTGVVTGGAGTTFEKIGTGGLTLAGAGNTAAQTTVTGGTLTIGGGGSLTSTVTNNATFATTGIVNGSVTNNATVTASNQINGDVQNNAGATFTVTGALTGIGTFTNDGAFGLGANTATIGSLAGTTSAAQVQTGTGTLNVGGNAASTTYAGVFTGAGTVNKVGAGILTLTGANGVGTQFTGTANVGGGTLRVNGTFGDTAASAATVNVNAGGTVDGIGTIAASVSVNNGGTFAAGNSPGTITVTNMTVNAGSNNVFELNTPNVAGGATNDLVNVTNNLTINGGTLTLQNAAVSGAYRLYSVGGTFTPGAGPAQGFDAVAVSNGTATLYTSPVPAGVPTQVNARISLGGQVVQFWDGADFSGAGAGAQGGTATWNNTNTNWVYDAATATVNDSWQSQVAVFGGTAGTVTIGGTVGAQGVQFTTNGYTIAGGTLNLLGDAPGGDAAHTFFNVDAGVTATINSAITGAGVGLRTRVGTGTLQLGGGSTYSGGTLTDAGTNLVVLGGGSIVGTSGVTNNGTFTLNAGGIVTTGGAVTNNNGGTFTTAGLLNAGSVTNNVGGTFNLAGGTTTTPTVANSGIFNQSAGTLNATTSVTNNAGATFNLSGGTITTPTATNAGTFNHTGGSLAATSFTTAAGGAYNQGAGGTVTSATIVNNGTYTAAGTNTATTSFTNNGTLAVSSSISTPTFTNTAIVNGLLTVTGNTTATNTASGVLNGGINIAAAGGGATFANAGTAGTGGLVFGNIGGTLTANNTGTFAGFVNTLAGTSTTVSTSGTWNYQGTSTLAGTETFSNTGTFRVASAGTLTGLESFTNAAGGRFELAANLGGSIGTFNNNATNPGSAGLGSQGNGTGQGVFTGPGVFLQDRNLTGIGTFNNNGFLGAVSTAGGANNTIGAASFNNGATGVISLVNGRSTDQLTLAGNYNGAAGSQIALDVNLNQTVRQADVVRINGLNNGQTTLVLNRLDNPATAFFSTQAIPVVVSGGGAGQVTLAQPIQGSGFATFELEQSSPGSYQIVSRLNTSAASGAASSISALITSLNVGFFQSVSAFIGAPSGNNDEKTASTSVSTDPTMTWAKLNQAAAAQTEVAAAPGIRPNTISSGLWARGSGGNFTVRGTSTAVFGPGTSVPQAVKVENSFAGMQVGIDTGVFNIDNTGWNLHLGITGGSVFADGTQKIGSQTTGVFDVPFIGVYSALTNGPFFSDLSYRHDFFNAKISNQLAGLNGANLKIESNAVAGSAGYRFDFESLMGTELPYFIEPSGSMSYTNTSVGSLPVTGGVLQFRDIDSILGRFGLRFGTAFQATESLALQPFVTGSVWHEFAGNTVSRFVSANIVADPNAFVPIITDRVGTFGQVGVGVSAQVLDTPFLGYVRSDFRFGDKLEGYAVNGGIRYQF
jgi:autotransporter-associated beta strand protein